MNMARLLSKAAKRLFPKRIHRHVSLLWILLSAAKKRKGFRATLRSLRFDLQYGVDTYQPMDLSEPDCEGDNVAAGTRYAPADVRLVSRLFKQYLPRVDSSSLVDFGSGAGRVMFIAALHQVREITGVEFSRQLCQRCLDNITKFQKKRPLIQSNFRVENIDAAKFAIPDHCCVFFFFNPFNAKVFHDVEQNILASLGRSPRKILIIYFHPPEGAFQSAPYSVVETFKGRPCVIVVEPADPQDETPTKQH